MKARLLLTTLVAAVSISSAGAAGMLEAPRLVEASDAAYENSVLITWTAVPGAEAYRVLRHRSDDWLHATQIGVTSDTSFIDPITTRNPRQQFHYWIVAEAGNAVSAYSNSDVGRPRIRPGGPRNPQQFRQNFRRLRDQLSR